MNTPSQTLIVKIDEPTDEYLYIRYELVDADGTVPNPHYDSKNRKKDAEPKRVQLATTDVDGEQVFVTEPGKYHPTEKLMGIPDGFEGAFTETWYRENILGIVPEVEESATDETA